MKVDNPMAIDIQPDTSLPGCDLLAVNHTNEDGQAPVTSVVVAAITGVSPAFASSDDSLQIALDSSSISEDGLFISMLNFNQHATAIVFKLAAAEAESPIQQES